MDFTLSKYEAICAALVETGYHSIAIGDYIQQAAIATPASEDREPVTNTVLLRHDVDSRPRQATKLAAIEQRYGLTATYFFRTVKSVFHPATIRTIHAMGHEVGYHYETLAQTRGNMEQAIVRFEQELARLRELVDVKVAAMHGSPLMPWDNRAIWQHTAPADFGLVGEVYRDIDYDCVLYLNDTGRTWNPVRYNLRDSTTHRVAPQFWVDSTDELIALIRSEQASSICLSTHPERWQANRLLWLIQASRDTSTNLIKVALKQLYGTSAR